MGYTELDFKKKYYHLLREIKWLATTCKHDRCPIFKQCCHVCELMHTKMEKIKNDMLKNEEKWE